MMNVLVSSTPVPVQYANWRGSIIESVLLMMWYLTILSIAFIAKEVTAMGQRSFRALMLLPLGMGITMECLNSSGSVQQAKEPWNRS